MGVSSLREASAGECGSQLRSRCAGRTSTSRHGCSRCGSGVRRRLLNATDRSGNAMDSALGYGVDVVHKPGQEGRARCPPRSRDQREGVLVESPRGNATTLSGSPASAASWWVAITIEGRPARSACSRMRRHVSIPSASNPPSGSSITNNRGSAARARAMATRWRSPVESRRTSLFRSCSRLSVVKSSRAR